jgi:carboxypeptidase Taq
MISFLYGECVNMDKKYQELTEILNEVADFDHASALLGWDQQTYMPKGGVEARGQQLSTLRKISHMKFTSAEVGALLDDLQKSLDDLDADSDEARLLKVTQREYEKQTKVPADMVAEFSRVTSIAQQAWQEARKEDNFSLFQPHLEKVMDLRRQYAELFSPYEHIYDPLLDDFEPGLKTKEVQEIFTALRPKQVALVKAIKEQPQIDDSFLLQEYDLQAQWDFGSEVITKFGYDWNHGRMDKAAHPFTTSFGMDDVRITTRVFLDDIASGLSSTMHESGHALYDLGINHEYDRTPLGEASSLAIHESQSRMWENLVGKSFTFWEYFYPRLQDHFPKQLKDVQLEKFYKGINKVEPSLIRVDADEATYNLHIMLRLELEIALMEGSLLVKDLPDAWNACMEEYLGIIPPSDANGVLQDIHWSAGLVGYFSTYALGNIISVQLWERILQDIPDLYEQFRKGEFSSLLEWLRSHIHVYGAKYEPKELVLKATGSKIDPDPYMRYLENKYKEIYDF